MFSMGLSTYQVPFSLHKTNRTKVIKTLLQDPNNEFDIVLLQGGLSQNRNDTDHEPIFRQESYFHYLFGVKEPDWYGILDLHNQTCILFYPRFPKEYATWMGRIAPPDEFRAHYGVDQVQYVDEMESYLESLLLERCNGNPNKGKILLMKGQNSDSGNMYEPPTFKSQKLNDKANVDILFPILADARVFKSEEEL